MLQISISKRKLEKLGRVAEQVTGVQQQRARAILLAAEGMSADDIGKQVHLTSRQVSYWVRRFERYGSDIFLDGTVTDGKQDAQDVKKESTRTMKISVGDRPGVKADNPMSEAGRKILTFHFARMLDEESSLRKGEDDEAVHDMRVATRRLRSALDIFGDFYHEHTIDSIRKDLRRIGKALGAVRDLEVVKQRADHYAEALSHADQDAFDPLLHDWKAQLDEARDHLLNVLDSNRYVRFLASFEEFLTTPGQAAVDVRPPQSFQVQHVAPAMIYRRYETVRAYEPILDTASLDTLHALRIDAKRLRYTLEAFEEVLGPEAHKVIDAIKTLQDHLGELQDARVAAGLIQDFIRQSDSGADSQSMKVILQYLADREGEKQRLLAGVSKNWTRFTRAEMKRALALAISTL